MFLVGSASGGDCHSGWAAGQLEEEMGRNGWINVSAAPEIIFDTPVAQRYDKKAGLGTIISLMVPYVFAILGAWLLLFTGWWILDIPLGHKDAAFVRSHFDGMEVQINDAPRANEIMVAVAVTDSGRPLPRVGGVVGTAAARPDARPLDGKPGTRHAAHHGTFEIWIVYVKQLTGMPVLWTRTMKDELGRFKPGVAILALELGVPLLGEIPLFQPVREGGDAGTPIVISAASMTRAVGLAAPASMAWASPAARAAPARSSCASTRVAR